RISCSSKRITCRVTFSVHGVPRQHRCPDATLLPLADLSEGGEIDIARAGPRPVVMFLTFRGILDHYAGFVYCEDGVSATDALFETSSKDSIEHDGHWYWVTR